MRFQNDKGEIQISSEVFTTITGAVATSCFGVKGMAARSKKDGLVHLLRSESMAKGDKADIIDFQEERRKKVYPNDPCPCGSGKKYKHCCGKKK